MTKMKGKTMKIVVVFLLVTRAIMKVGRVEQNRARRLRRSNSSSSRWMIITLLRGGKRMKTERTMTMMKITKTILIMKKRKTI